KINQDCATEYQPRLRNRVSTKTAQQSINQDCATEYQPRLRNRVSTKTAQQSKYPA
ncbi:hypothetical protein LSAT2_003311, partial [Lamellibrachia satsuma]